MADQADAVQVEHFAFEPAGREGQVRQRRQRRIACGHDAFEFDAAVRPAGQKQVHDPQPVAVVMGRHQGQSKTVGQEFLGLLREAIARNPVQHWTWVHGNAPSWLAAVLNRSVSGPAVIPSAIEAVIPTSSAP